MALLTAGTGERTTEAQDMGPRYVFYFILLSLFFLHKKKKKKDYAYYDNLWRGEQISVISFLIWISILRIYFLTNSDKLGNLGLSTNATILPIIII